jgi:hypothetical protein
MVETNAGISIMLQLLASTATPVPFGNANARIGVGDGAGSVPTVAATDTTLRGTTNTAFAPMNATYPQATATTTMTWQATFAAGVGTFAWREWCIDNGAGGGPGTLFNHKGVSLGTKTAGSTWTFQVSVTQT